jgi:hypothetical protein
MDRGVHVICADYKACLDSLAIGETDHDSIFCILFDARTLHYPTDLDPFPLILPDQFFLDNGLVNP